jgi:hypothetical protein
LIQNEIKAKNIRVEVGSTTNEIKNPPIFQKLIQEKLQANNLLMVTKYSRNTLEFLKLQDIFLKKMLVLLLYIYGI